MALGRFTSEKLKLLDRLLDQRRVPRQVRRITPTRLDPGNLPLSSAQRRIWFFDRLAPASPMYNIVGVARLTGALDAAVLRRCLNEVVRRHEVLRTTFHEGESGPRARVRPPRPLNVPVVDLSTAQPAERAAAVEEWRSRQACRPFDLTGDQMMRAVLLKTAADEHLLLIGLHHIAADGWSLGVLVRELAALYGAFSVGRPSPLAELAIQYSDFTAWQNERMEEEAFGEALADWRRWLDGATPVDLPTERARHLPRTFAGDSLPMDVPPDLARAVQKVADTERATPFMVLLAAFAVVLHRWSGQDDLVVGAPIANRDQADIEDLIGFFVNTLPIRIGLSGSRSFRALLRRTREACVNGYARQDVPFERIIEALHPVREPTAHTPLIRHTLVLHNTPRRAMELPNVSMDVVAVHTGTAKFDLQIELAPTGTGGLTGFAEFSTDLHDRRGVRTLLGGLTTLLRDAVARPDEPIGHLRTMDEVERQRLTAGLSRPPRPAAADGLVHRGIEEQVRRTADALAITDGRRRCSYRDLDTRASRLARHLRDAGAGSEDLVAICLPRSIESVVAMLGVLKSGAAYVPLEATHPRARLAEIIADCAPRLVVTAPDVAPPDERGLTRPEIVYLDEAVTRADGPKEAVPVGPRNAAYVIYTSGSTGRPKGAINEHGAVANRMAWMQEAFPLRPGDVVLHKTPLGFDVSGWEWAWPLAHGVPVVVAEAETHRDAAHLARLIADNRVTVCHFVPSMLRAFLEDGAVPGCAGTLRTVICSGEELPPALVREFRRVLPGVALANLYGPAEAAIDVTAWPVPPDDPLESARVPIGHPISGVAVHILDDVMRPVPAGAAGELYIGGAAVGRGYHRRRVLTAERFVPDPFDAGRRLYRTGDRARRRGDGAIEFLGRVDHQVKLRGQRIEPAEIEAVLADHPLVTGTLVTTSTDARAETRLVAYVTLRPDDSDDPGDHLDRWRQVFDQTYGADVRVSGADEDFSGWNSSYTGGPIPQEEMREWVEETVARVRLLRPRRVLEIGCGTGLLLSRIAPRCESYQGTDVSAAALARIKESLVGRDSAVRLERRPADDFSGCSDGSVDTVILNSVIQYFPDEEYLTRVLERAVRALAPGGHLFVGDVRDYRLLEALHASVLTYRLPPETDGRDVARLVARRVAAEEELLVDPAFFTGLRARMPDAENVTMLLKSGPYDNELSRFRYDVILRKAAHDGGGRREPPPEEPLGRLPSLLAAPRRHPFALRNLRDGRVFADVTAARLLREGESAYPATLGELHRACAAVGRAGVADPAELARQAARAGFVMYAMSGRQAGMFDAVYEPAEGHCLPPTEFAPLAEGPAARHTNDPRRAVRQRATVTALRAHARRRLPEYMVPSVILPLPEWPLGTNGKVDRRALPPPDEPHPGATAAYVPPRTATERAVADIWRDLLGFGRIGVHDDFFALGGHSLLATQLTARIQRDLGVALPLGEVFSAPSVAGLAASIDVFLARGGTAPIRRAVRRPAVPATYVETARASEREVR